ncbi:MAG: hypothetical protein ACXW4L_01150 [Candidatus Limnocylindrales bacterium]
MTRRKRGSVSGTLGGIIVGFDQQIFRTTPPVQELVAKGQPVRGVSGEGGAFEVVFPDEAPTEPEAQRTERGASDAEPAAE